MDWSDVDYCGILSAVWTLILMAPIHCRGSIGEQVMECYISPYLMKKQTHLRWPEDEHIFRKSSFWACQRVNVRHALIFSVRSLISLTAPLYLLASSLSSSCVCSFISLRCVHSSSVLLKLLCNTKTDQLKQTQQKTCNGYNWLWCFTFKSSFTMVK